MTQEEKELLLKDLCARLPYGIKIKLGKYTATVCEVTRNYFCTEGSGEKCYSIDLYKPYLRPMSSMTEEEESEYNLIQGLSHWTADDGKMENYAESIDWLNSHHFDYRGLIEKGLALEAPEGMYNTKTE